MEKKCKQIGVIDNSGYEKVNRVYRGGVLSYSNRKGLQGRSKGLEKMEKCFEETK